MQVKRSRLLAKHGDWQMITDLGGMMAFPQYIVITNLRPDIVVWSDQGKEVLLVELTVPREENMEVAHERKMTKYDTLRMEIEMKGWRCKVLPVEMGCRGYASRALIAYLRGIGLSAAEIKKDNERTGSCSRVSFELDLAGITPKPKQIMHSPDGPYICWWRQCPTIYYGSGSVV